VTAKVLALFRLVWDGGLHLFQCLQERLHINLGRVLTGEETRIFLLAHFSSRAEMAACQRYTRLNWTET
jgi:hypothetical protein